MDVLSRNPWNISVFDQFSLFRMAPDLDYKRYGMCNCSIYIVNG